MKCTGLKAASTDSRNVRETDLQPNKPHLMQEEYGSPLADPGEGPGGGEPPYFYTKLRPEGQKICFLGRAPSLQGLYDQPPLLPI